MKFRMPTFKYLRQLFPEPKQDEDLVTRMQQARDKQYTLEEAVDIIFSNLEERSCVGWAMEKIALKRGEHWLRNDVIRLIRKRLIEDGSEYGPERSR